MSSAKILICVLDWGLGHATRSLALIQELESRGIEVVIGSSGQALSLLSIELPGRRFYDLPPYHITYRDSDFVTGIISQLPRIFRTIAAENKVIKTIVDVERPVAIISDCRYGCYDKRIRSILLSHQLEIQLYGAWSLLKGLVNFFHQRMISHFDDIWVPDYPDRSLSGDLSHSQFSLTFIGPLTTMKRSIVLTEKKYDVLAVISGPEPQRTLFAKLIRDQLRGGQRRWLMVHGLPRQDNQRDDHNVPFMTRKELNEAMQGAGLIVARSGYSTLMDIAALGSKAVFVPTPGQTEQVYLADQLMKKGIALCQEQNRLDLEEAMKEAKAFNAFPHMNGESSQLLANALKTLIES